MTDDHALKIPVRLGRLPREGQVTRLSADQRERAKLAALNDLVSLDSLDVEFVATPIPKGVEVRGSLSGKLVQTCVVTGNPVHQTLENDFVIRFVRKPVVHGMEIEFSVMDEEEEPYPGDEADLGPIIEEYFTMAVDPYPRCEGASFEPIEEDAGSDNPFAALGALKSKKTGKS